MEYFFFKLKLHIFMRQMVGWSIFLCMFLSGKDTMLHLFSESIVAKQYGLRLWAAYGGWFLRVFLSVEKISALTEKCEISEISGISDQI
jgi:hypothetical protein